MKHNKGMAQQSDLISAIPLPALIINADGRIATANTMMSALFGLNLAGLSHITVLRKPALLDAIEAAKQDKIERKTKYLGHDGARETSYDVSITPVADQVVVIFEDISAAAEIEKFRRDFIANVSHELRTPLTSLLGFIETLQGPARDDRIAQQRFLSIMSQEADRMRQLVDDLLSLSRVEEDERIRPQDQVDFSLIVPSVIEGLQPLADAANLNLVFEVTAGSKMVLGDDFQLRQVLSNLMSNAIKYGASSKGVRVNVSGPRHDPALQGESITIEVRDFGEGVALHHIARLTERFYRVDSHRSREVGGTGLGLAIVKHIVSRHRGRMLIESDLGQGTTFKVILPAILK